MAVELTVILKDAERTYRHKFLSYENITLRLDDPIIDKYVKEAMQNLEGEFDDIIIKTSMVLK